MAMTPETALTVIALVGDAHPGVISSSRGWDLRVLEEALFSGR